MTDKVIQSYVHYGDQMFFVSTINRESSVAVSPSPLYAETMVWELDTATQARKDKRILWQGEDGKDGMSSHFKACRELREHGRVLDEDDEK